MGEGTVVLENLSIGYRTKKNRHAVATGINASLHGAELTCLIGSNGIGKSTLLKTLSAFLSPLAGCIRIDGKDIADYTSSQLAKKIGVVLTGRPEPENLTVEELAGMGRSPYTGFWGTLSAADSKIVDEALKKTGILHLKGRNIQTLSDGERQKVMIAKALAQQTSVIFLDEPTAFLDFPSKVEALLMLRQLAHSLGKTIFLSTHDVELALQTADRVWLMDRDGLHVGSAQTLAKEQALTRFLEQSHATFDPQTLTLRVTEPEKDKSNQN